MTRCSPPMMKCYKDAVRGELKLKRKLELERAGALGPCMSFYG